MPMYHLQELDLRPRRVRSDDGMSMCHEITIVKLAIQNLGYYSTELI